MANHLDADQAVYALQGDYRRSVQDSEYTPEEIESWAADYLKVLRQFQPEGPYMLGGMCTGALIAFDMAIQLEAEGQQVALLASLIPGIFSR